MLRSETGINGGPRELKVISKRPISYSSGLMQILIDIPEEEITLLDRLSEDRHISREELVRTAI